MSTWKDKITSLEITPPDQAWTDISNRRKFPRYIKSGFGILVIAAAALAYQHHGFVETPTKELTATASSSPSVLDNNNLSQEKNIPANSIEENVSIPPQPPTEQAIAQAKDETPILNPYPFPYNGSVHSRANTVESTPLPSERSHPSEESIIVPEQTETPVEETIEIETPALADHQFTIADHFSPNQDGWNDGFSPALQLPADFKFIQWSLYRNQQWIRSWNENNSWDGNDLGGYPMESGTYHYTLTYEDDQQVVHTKKGTISLQR